MATTQKNEDVRSAAEAETGQERPTRYFSRDTNTQHPDTRTPYFFKQGEEVPEWALTVVGPDSIAPLTNPDLPEVDTGPTPGRHQGIASNLIGDETSNPDLPTIAEQTAAGPVGLDEEPPPDQPARRRRAGTETPDE